MKNYRLSLVRLIFIMGMVLLFRSIIYVDNQTKTHTFQRTSNLPEVDRGIAVIETKTGDIVAIGVIKKDPQANGDILLVCSEATGNVKWTRTFGGEGDDMGWDLIEIPIGGFLLAGTSNSHNQGSRDIIVIKTDSMGKEVWKKTYGTEREEYCWDMAVTQDGNVLLAGETSIEGPYGKGNKDFYAVKIDLQGNLIWSQTYGGNKTDRCYAVDSTPDGFVLLGSTNSYGAGDQDVYLIKINPQGREQWSKTFGSEKFDMGHDVKRTHDGGYIIIGYSQTQSQGKNDSWIIKIDSKGNKLWESLIGEKEDDRTVRGIQTKDGNYVMTGYTKSYGASIWDLLLIKIDKQGKVTWRRNHSGISADLGYGIFESKDGGILLAGQTYSYGNHRGDLWLLKTDVHGKISKE